LPVIIFSIYWRRFNTTGAVAGMLVGLISAVTLVMLGPSVMQENAIFPLANPGIISVPLGFVTSVLFTLLSKPDPLDDKYDELSVKANTGLGTET
jgi:cation/acetate symporter